jgi:hypothetical protein
MRILILFLLGNACFLISCKDKPKGGGSSELTHPAHEALSSILGSWTGMFDPSRAKMVWDDKEGDSVPVLPNKITIFIDQLENGIIKGYIVCAGNDRPFEGTYSESGDHLEVKAKEPGNSEFDGSFEFEIVQTPSLSLSGTWKANDRNHVDRKYSLVRKNFEYAANTGIFPEASTRLLTEDDVNNAYKEDLRIMRNEIYARHGYSFKLKDMRQHFDFETWYMPFSTDVRKKLTPIELKNATLIKRYEKYAESSYDDYGR